eukprot:601788-Pyramimonas_sp.AAC.1
MRSHGHSLVPGNHQVEPLELAEKVLGSGPKPPTEVGCRTGREQSDVVHHVKNSRTRPVDDHSIDGGEQDEFHQTGREGASRNDPLAS